MGKQVGRWNVAEVLWEPLYGRPPGHSKDGDLHYGGVGADNEDSGDQGYEGTASRSWTEAAPGRGLMRQRAKEGKAVPGCGVQALFSGDGKAMACCEAR